MATLAAGHPGPRHRKRPNGYSRLAAFIANDTELSVYRRFERLGSRNLLYLQSEPRALEADLEHLDSQDLEGELDPSKGPRIEALCFEELIATEDSSEDSRRRMKNQGSNQGVSYESA